MSGLKSKKNSNWFFMADYPLAGVFPAEMGVEVEIAEVLLEAQGLAEVVPVEFPAAGQAQGLVEAVPVEQAGLEERVE